jgi:hypothetical protein
MRCTKKTADRASLQSSSRRACLPLFRIGRLMWPINMNSWCHGADQTTRRHAPLVIHCTNPEEGCRPGRKPALPRRTGAPGQRTGWPCTQIIRCILRQLHAGPEAKPAQGGNSKRSMRRRPTSASNVCSSCSGVTISGSSNGPSDSRRSITTCAPQPSTLPISSAKDCGYRCPC